MSELLRATVDHASSAVLKKNVQEKKTQISFRLSEPLYSSLFRAANQSGQSIARIIRTLLESAPRLGIRPKGFPAQKKRGTPAKKTGPAATPATKKAALVKKSAVKSAKKSQTMKKVEPSKKAIPAKKKAAKRK